MTYFSYDENHEYKPDDSSLNYYYPPRLGANLCDGFETFKQLDDSGDDHLDSLLQCISSFEEEDEQQQGKRCEADFITWRGMMTKIMTAPFDRFNRYFLFNLSFFFRSLVWVCFSPEMEEMARTT